MTKQELAFSVFVEMWRGERPFTMGDKLVRGHGNGISAVEVMQEAQKVADVIYPPDSASAQLNG